MTAPPILFDGRVAIVTGGGRGLGRAYCLELAARGAAVIVNDISPVCADEVVAEIVARDGVAAASHASVATPAGAQAIVDVALERFGTVDALINNAGFMRNGYVEELDPAALDEVLAVHVRGSWLTTRAAWPALRRRGGRVLVASSAGGLFAMQGESNYAAAKAGLFGLTKALAFEGREHGIRVNALLPMATTRIETAQPVPDYDRHYPAAARDVLAPRRDVAAVVPIAVYLASDACSVSGEAFAAGFGRFARVFVGETPGWVAPDHRSIDAEAVAAHLDEIRRLDGFAVPTDIYDEVAFIAATVSAAATSTAGAAPTEEPS